ncbi:MAG TPA: maleylpyruvate isomerase N-terminal domain-containing protein [Actinomycetota bacterium]|nr:maleylpyruvate isomerase N-terminal domain-containing protein [Actinomycetota bacterium]
MDERGMAAAVEDAAARVGSLLRSVKDPQAPAVGTWKIRDVAVHLAGVFSAYPGYLDRSTPLFEHPMDVVAHNEAVVSSDETTDLGAVADRIEASATGLAGALTAGAATGAVPWHGGSTIPGASIPAIAVTEAFVHGHDIAAAEGRRCQFPRRPLAFGLRGLLDVLPLYVDRERAADAVVCFDVRIRGGERAGLVFHRGTLTVHEGGAPSRPDCTLWVDPGGMLLVGYERVSPLAAVARGWVAAWGRKPWLGLALPKLIRQP